MVRGRLLARSLSTSRRYAALYVRAPDLAEFAQLLYPLLMIHADDYGRFDGDPWTVKQVVLPASPRPPQNFEQALAALTKVGLLIRYGVAGRTYYEVNNFKKHQHLKFQAPSEFPAPSNGRTEQNRTEQNRTNRTERLRREDRSGELSACPHTPRCDDVPLCRKIASVDAAVQAGEITKARGAGLRRMWRTAPTMLAADGPSARPRAKRR